MDQLSAPTVVSLFSGAGGLDLGFKNAGFNLLWANDFDQDSVASYNANIGDHAVLGDITTIDLATIPNSDVIIGGFPCQGFSIANTGRSVDDSRNFLYKSFVNIVQTKQPKIFLAENVKGILSLGKGLVFEHILDEFMRAGYRCQFALVNAADYGTPQNRRRVLILGIRNDLPDVEIQWPPSPSHTNHHISVGEALKDIPEPDSEHELHNHVKSNFKMKNNGYIGHRTIDPNKPAPTVTARGDNRGGAVIMHHPSNERRMTCRELATIQGFPSDFIFCGSMTSTYRQIGNAVPSQLAFAAAKSIRAILSKL